MHNNLNNPETDPPDGLQDFLFRQCWSDRLVLGMRTHLLIGSVMFQFSY